MNRVRAAAQWVASGLVAGVTVWMLATHLYRPTLVLGVVIGLVASVWFLVAHRPRFWFRPEALGAAGLVVAMALLYVRQAVLLIITWPGTPPRSFLQAYLSLSLLGLVDLVLVARLVIFRRFVARDRAGLLQPGQAATAAEVQALLDRITALEAELGRARAGGRHRRPGES